MTIPPSTPPTPDAERQLLARLSGDDEDDANRAMDEIITRYQTVVKKTAWSILRDHDAVADVTQSVWITCWERCRALAVRGRLREYLTCVARTRALNWRRDEHRQQQFIWTVAEDIAEDGNTVENEAIYQLAAADHESIVRAAVAAMPPRRRDIYECVTRDGYTHDEAARLLHLSSRTVSNQMWQANQDIHRALMQSDSVAQAC